MDKPQVEDILNQINAILTKHKVWLSFDWRNKELTIEDSQNVWSLIMTRHGLEISNDDE